MENNSITKLILGFLVLIVGLALIGSIATNSSAVTEKTGVGGEALTIIRANEGDCPMGINLSHPYSLTNSPTGWKTDSCPISSFILVNQVGATATDTTDYVLFPDNGTLMLKNTTVFVLANCSSDAGVGASNDSTLFYEYCGDDYMNIAWGRTLLDLISGFFALALLGVGVGIFYSVARDTGIISK